MAAVTIELCLQVHVNGDDAESSSRTGVAVQHLAVAREEPLMLAACSNGRLQLYDLRQSQRAAASVQPHKTPMVKLHSCRRLTVFVVIKSAQMVATYSANQMLAVQSDCESVFVSTNLPGCVV